VDPLIVAAKIESLRRCVARIEARRPTSSDALARDADAQDILTLNLTRAVQLCVDIGAHLVADSGEPAPISMGETFDRLFEQGIIDQALARRMKGAVGFRNIAIHNYQAIDWVIVHRIAVERLGDFHEFARRIAEHARLP
jgi:uncharacterized protein YutE (UPF0331/DUF86 family)